MKQLLVIVLITLATCATIEEDYDDVVLEKKFKNPIKKVTKPIEKVIKKPKEIIEKVEKVVKKPEQIVKQTVKDILKKPIKGLNGLFNGKLGKAFNKLSEVVKKGIAWLKQNKLWDPLVQQLKYLGQKYGNEFCEKYLPPEICGKAVDFVLDHVLKEDGN